jgi:5-methylcytosine-specific restriction endonuclease McrA
MTHEEYKRNWYKKNRLYVLLKAKKRYSEKRNEILEYQREYRKKYIIKNEEEKYRNRSESRKKLWQNPQFRAKMTGRKRPPVSDATRQKLSEAAIKRRDSGYVPWSKGLTKDDERIRLMTEKSHKTRIENGIYIRTGEKRRGTRIPRLSLAKRGDRNAAWKGGKTPYNKIYHGTVAWQVWRQGVFERDNYTCQLCGKIGGLLHPHHIELVSEHPEKVFDIDNGKTLCVPCHKKFNKELHIQKVCIEILRAKS